MLFNRKGRRSRIAAERKYMSDSTKPSPLKELEQAFSVKQFELGALEFQVAQIQSKISGLISEMEKLVVEGQKIREAVKTEINEVIANAEVAKK